MKTGTIRHVKTLRLKRRLGNTPDYILAGVLNMVWDMTAEQAPRGDIGRFTDEDIAAYIGWDGNDLKLIEALVLSGWLDECSENRLVVHDWGDHAPKYIKDRLRKNGTQFVSANPMPNPVFGASVTLDSCVLERHRRSPLPLLSVSDAPSSEKSHINGTERNPTERNPTQPKRESASEDAVEPDEFLTAWKSSGLVDCRKLTPKRLTALKARFKDPEWRKDWREAITKAAASAFCLGENERGWKADVDWFLKPDTFTKIMEGKYNDSTGTIGGHSSDPTRVYGGQMQEPTQFILDEDEPADTDRLPF